MDLALIVLSLLLVLVTGIPSAKLTERSSSYIALPFNKSTAVSRPALRERAFTATLTNRGTQYTIDVGIGTPPQPLSLILDTGSSEIWAYSSSCANCTTEPDFYDPSASSKASDRSDLGPFSVRYGDGSTASGFYVSDSFTTDDVTATGIVVGVATVADVVVIPEGIMGIGLPNDEASVTNSGFEYPSYIDQIMAQGFINVRAYSIYLDSMASSSGFIIFGGYDSSKWAGDLVPFPLIDPTPDGFYRLDVAEPAISLTLDDQTVLIPSTEVYAVLLDTGTYLTLLPQAQFNIIAAALGATVYQTFPSGEQLWSVACDYATASGGIDFAFSGPNGQVTVVVPWSEVVIDEGNGLCVLGLTADPEDTGVFILGDTFLRSAYLLYNFDDMTVSLAQASWDSSCSDCITPL